MVKYIFCMTRKDNTKWAGTAEVINFVHTISPVKTRLGVAFVNIDMTRFPGPATLAHARKPVANSVHTLSAILANVVRRVAHRNVNFTLITYEEKKIILKNL